MHHYPLRQLLFAFAILIFPFMVKGQNDVTDSTVSCVTWWNKGETRQLTIQRTKEKFEDDKKVSGTTLRYSAAVTVLDSTEDGYTMQWVYSLPEAMKKTNPDMVGSLPILNDLKIIYKIGGSGDFLELVNWQEILNAYVKMMEMSLPKERAEDINEVIEKTKEMFNSREAIESAMIGDVQIYHSPYGAVYPKTPVTASSQLESPLGGTPFPAIMKFEIKQVNETEDYFDLFTEEKLDSVNAKEAMLSLLKQMGLTSAEIEKELKEQDLVFVSNTQTDYRIELSTGWIKRVRYKQVKKVQDLKNVETYMIDLKK